MSGFRAAPSRSSSHFIVCCTPLGADFANRPALERLHILKKDASQIGQNARKSVKFLDKMTSGKNDLPNEPIIIQGPDEQYATWQEVESHYADCPAAAAKKAKESKTDKQATDVATKRSSGSALSQILLDKLNFAGPPQGSSPASTPPMSPTSSGPQSSKTSPEVRAATMSFVDKTPVPPVLKPLLNPVVWYYHEKPHDVADVFFLTNSADTQHLAREFNVATKTIHQLRDAIGMELQPAEPSKTSKKQRSTSNLAEGEPKTLFSYDDESEEEEVVFKPRARGAPRITANGRGSMRSKHLPRSPRPSFNNGAPAPQAATNKPKIPIEEIDPDSFDRGGFGRGSGQLANVSNTLGNHSGSFGANRPPSGPRGGNGHNGRGGYRGRAVPDRGAARGRGRLFVP
jgi:hypothetical protein